MPAECLVVGMHSTDRRCHVAGKPEGSRIGEAACTTSCAQQPSLAASHSGRWRLAVRVAPQPQRHLTSGLIDASANALASSDENSQ